MEFIISYVTSNMILSINGTRRMTDKDPIVPLPDSHDDDSDTNSNQCFFELSDYLKLDDDDQWPEPDDVVTGSSSSSFFVSTGYVPNQQDNQANDEVGHFGASGSHFEGSYSTREIGGREKKEGRDSRVAFITMSEVEVLDDGFRWRKYGKKMVKNSPNPRNYYRCSVDGCQVKKRVERDKDDPRYVITTYEGTHTHPTP